MRITDAKLSDIEGIADCAERFFEYARYEEKYGMPLDRESFKNMVTGYIQNGICLLLKDEKVVGGICGMVVPWGYNQNIKVGLELFYWVDPEYRGMPGVRLIREYEKRVEAEGARPIMICPETELTPMVRKIYEKRGYKPLESFWVKC